MDMKRAGCVALLALVACANPSGTAEDGTAGIFFPITHGLNATMDALNQGTMVERDGCILLSSGGHTVLILWPEGYAVRRNGDDDLRVVDQEGATVGSMGDRVTLGGGFLGEARGDTGLTEKIIEEPIPPRCRAGGYWAAAGLAESVQSP